MYQKVNEKGSALLITLCLMGMLTLVALTAVKNSNTDMELSFNSENSERAFYIAEAGAKRAVSEIYGSSTWRAGYNDIGFSGGTYTVQVIDSTSEPALDDTVIVSAVGELNNATAEVEIMLTPVYEYPFSYALFGDKGVSFDQTTCTDSYNSDSGSYATTVLSDYGSVGSNGTISTSKLVSIGGDAQTATPGGITLGAGTTVSGDTTTTADSVKIDFVPDAEFAWAQTNSTASTGLSGFGYTYNSGTKSLVLNTNSQVTLSSGVYYFSSISAGQYSQINLAAGAKVTVYVTGDIIFNQGSTFNAGGAPKDAIIYSQGSKLQFDQSNKFYGAFIGSNATVQYDQTTEVYGSIIASYVKLDKNACLHYDRDLASVRRIVKGETQIVAWREVF
ncbi:MAG: pilus assembly PilX N-terminal domain-containing protein [candidate division Zixibacteria bacterium]|nr:pilus assembly PilX N-terminal domain-containing protein [candidate division Zixibacteria bacterium]MDD5427513.1 pilus assembly PilX N-terminal domain-containing protein [candidate division Zixibacteria bacterium]